MNELFKARNDKKWRPGTVNDSDKNRPSRLERIVDVLSKLALPALTAIVAYYGYGLNESISVTQMLMQREASDTQIRAEMFKSISEQLFKEAEKKTLSPEKMAMFTQLLAMNFHQHIELKPLMLQAGRDLELSSSVRPNERLDELRSAARRVRARQIAMLMHVPQFSENSFWRKVIFLAPDVDLNATRLEYFGVRLEGNRLTAADEDKSTDLGPCDMRKGEGKNMCATDLGISLSPDQKQQLGFAFPLRVGNYVKYEEYVKKIMHRERFPLSVTAQPAKSDDKPASSKRSEAKEKCGGTEDDSTRTQKWGPTTLPGVFSADFDLTWFDFPITDNTVLSDGNRFSIFLAQVCQAKAKTKNEAALPATIKLGVFWFPRNYIPAYERPANYGALRQKTGIRMQD